MPGGLLWGMHRGGVDLGLRRYCVGLSRSVDEAP